MFHFCLRDQQKPDLVLNMPTSARPNSTMWMVSLKSSLNVDANSDPSLYRATNFSASNFRMKFDYDSKGLSGKDISYVLVWIDSSWRELFICGDRMFVYNETNRWYKFFYAPFKNLFNAPLLLGALCSIGRGLLDFTLVHSIHVYCFSMGDVKILALVDRMGIRLSTRTAPLSFRLRMLCRTGLSSRFFMTPLWA